MKIGITGGIGAGKSAVSAYLRSLGETVVCADEVAHEVTAPGAEGALALRRVFGDAYFTPDGALDRRKLAQTVFSDPEQLRLLNATLHPLILERIDALARQTGGRVFIDAALLIQTGMHRAMDYVWLVVADKETRIRRVMARDGLSEAQVKKRMDSQLTDEQMASCADEIIRNHGDMSALKIQIDRLLEQPKYM